MQGKVINYKKVNKTHGRNQILFKVLRKICNEGINLILISSCFLICLFVSVVICSIFKMIMMMI
ncbi:TPA: hypothetical protein KQG29_001525 [Clostridioides difficile]|nr:hypothetical protein [Clostridioides difficile]